MGKVITSKDSGSIPAIKTVVIFADEATRMNSAATSFLADGDEFVSYSGTGASDEEAGFPITIPEDFKSVIDISIEHTSSATANTVNYKMNLNHNDTNYSDEGEELVYPVRAGAGTSWDKLTDTVIPSTTVFEVGQDYSFRTHSDATLDTYTGTRYIRCVIFKYSTV